MINLEHAPLPDCTIAQIALDFPQSIRILNRYDLDYYCQGQKRFTEICRQRQIDAEVVWEEILKELPVPSGNMNHRFDSWDISLLTDFICQNHHEYVRVAAPRLCDLIDRTITMYGDRYPILAEIATHFRTLTDDLLEHLPKEEEILFPAIRKIWTSPLSRANASLTGNVAALLDVMECEHANAVQVLRLLRSLTSQYTPPPGINCPTFHLVFKLLEEFDNDLVQHIHLENNILFARTKQ